MVYKKRPLKTSVIESEGGYGSKSVTQNGNNKAHQRPKGGITFSTLLSLMFDVYEKRAKIMPLSKLNDSPQA